MKIKWIVFDMMGVLFKDKDDVKACLIPFLRENQIKESDNTIYQKYISASLGNIKSKKFWEYFKLSNLDQEYLDIKLKYDSKSLDVVKRFKENFHFGIISNDLSEWSIYLRKKYGIADWISISIISGDVGIRKPDKGIYNIFLEKANISPQECIFIDDNIKNLLPAKKIGFQCILFAVGQHSCTHFHESQFSENDSGVQNRNFRRQGIIR